MNAPSTKTVSVSSNKGFRAAVRRKRRGYTLIEVLIGATLTLILLGIMIRAFTFAGDAISKGRAVIELTNELRTASDTLRHDLRSATASMLPWSSLGSDEGYFEYVEGPTRDYSFVNDGTNPRNDIDPDFEGASLTSFGDGDDVLSFTARNLEQPYQGVFNGVIIESKVAEICWWTTLNEVDVDVSLGADESVTLYRRVLLVAPSLNDTTTGFIPGTVNTAGDAPNVHLGKFMQSSDVSVRYDSTNNALIANSLADLTKRENRFAHNFATFPHPLIRDFATPPTILNSLEGSVLRGEREGEDVILSHVAAFDVKIYDPEVLVRRGSLPDGTSTALVPSDWGYWITNPAGNLFVKTAGPPPEYVTGGYVDLKYAQHNASAVTTTSTIYPIPAATQFSGNPTGGSRLINSIDPYPKAGPLLPSIPPASSYATYCTWSSHYERDGVDQDGADGADQGTDGIDNDGTFGVDDEGERETSPPYPYPVRGVKVTFRVRDPASQQLRQTSVESSFIPE